MGCKKPKHSKNLTKKLAIITIIIINE